MANKQKCNYTLDDKINSGKMQTALHGKTSIATHSRLDLANNYHLHEGIFNRTEKYH